MHHNADGINLQWAEELIRMCGMARVLHWRCMQCFDRRRVCSLRWQSTAFDQVRNLARTLATFFAKNSHCWSIFSEEKVEIAEFVHPRTRCETSEEHPPYVREERAYNMCKQSSAFDQVRDLGGSLAMYYAKISCCGCST